MTDQKNENDNGNKSNKTSGTVQPINLYEILELKPNATKEEIRKAYKKMSLLYHPGN
jgi:DnaJ-class molecular chaperone